MRKANILYITRTLQYVAPNTVIFNLVQNLNPEYFQTYICCLFASEEKKINFTGTNAELLELNIKNKWDIFKIFHLLKFVKDKNIDIINAHYPIAHLFGLFASKICRIPIVFTSHDIDNWKIRKGNVFSPLFTQCVVPLTNYVVTVSNELQKYILNKKKNKIATIYNGLKLNENTSYQKNKHILKKYKLGSNMPIAGTFSRLDERKGIDTLIRAVSILKKKGTLVHALIAGDGPLKNELISLTKKENVENQIHFLGFVEDIHNIMNIIDIVVLTSLWEGTSLSLLEAMSYSKSIIATDVGGNPELIDDRRNGFIIPPNNPKILAEKIFVFLDKNKRDRAGKEARKSLEEYFTVRKMAINYENVYLNLLG